MEEAEKYWLGIKNEMCFMPVPGKNREKIWKGEEKHG